MIRNLFNLLLDIVFPKDKETILIENLSTTRMREIFGVPREMQKSNYLALFDYREPLVRKAVWLIKYKANRKIASKFAELIYEEILEIMSDETTFSKYDVFYVVPIPCSKKRLKEKGFNQTDILVDEIIKFSCDEKLVKKDLLLKTKETPHQVNVRNREKRLKNLEGSFSVKKDVNVKRSLIFLIDDVITTGATMSEACKTLKQAGAKKVLCVAVGH